MTASPPPTPPSRPVRDDERRLHTINLPCEWLEDYRPGGCHPVHLGDSFKDGQYKVIRKLGDGSYSTVWLARDLSNCKYVAMKILVSDISASTNEVQILRQLNGIAPAQGARHVTQLLDEFEHSGPNGIHKCLVFEPMGPSVNSMVEELPQFNPRKWGMKVRYPPQMARSILKQSLQGLEFLHGNGIAHGDFQPGNILFALNNIDSKPEDVLRQREDVQAMSISDTVRRLDGKQDKWAPHYLCVGQPLVRFTSYAEDFKIKLSDMGGGSDFEDDDHILALTERLGPLPDELFKRWRTSSLYFTPERKLYNCQLGGVPQGKQPLLLQQTSMEDLFDQAGPEIDGEESRQVKALIRRILQYDPTKRPSPTEILEDPWMRKSGSL
ncbi:serine/threonine-protein kinase SRPK3 [Verticillium dahliae VdLs.17]|uniref:non-specific serine/threonine protein kinase n=1 Tax=Verticillium dahliae (strain VdLs.17 / ATCC MYA-4575 / FGSC 10137) TaxID=498257 RepID=G2XBG3_VERDV|nr:serine/threonine-protein kinase SRPK3 [Verticillium dahliae VdLs.17]EGY16331.1 serine/threonine-protein kinase SRPK3 [Verticillium dahliae VdLs.17]KAH6699381.1 serine/threonine-protein kinase SRPK3 [Verticillium dahliae]